MKKLYLILGVVVAVIGVGAVACGSLTDAGQMVMWGGVIALVAGILLAGGGLYFGRQPKPPVPGK